MAKGIRINKVKTASQKQFHRIKRIKKKAKKRSTKKLAVTHLEELNKVGKKQLSGNEKKLIKKAAKIAKKEKTKMEVEAKQVEESGEGDEMVTDQ